MKIYLLLLMFLFGSLTRSFCQSSDFPYKLSFSKDIPLLSCALTSEAVTLYLVKNRKINYLTYSEVERLNINDIVWYDRSVIKYWSPKLADLSDITKGILAASPALLFLPQIANEKWENFLILGVMYIEGAALNGGVNGITRRLTQRIRPYLYNNTSITEREKRWLCQPGQDYSYISFYSGHTSIAFFSAVFLSKVYTDIYGKGYGSYIIWGASLFGAATTGYLRYKSGWHYPSDVIVGAIAGSLIGYIIPVLHKKRDKSKISFLISPNYGSVAYHF